MAEQVFVLKWNELSKDVATALDNVNRQRTAQEELAKKSLKQILTEKQDEFAKLGISLGIYSTANKYWWQEIRYGPVLKKYPKSPDEEDQLFRGYLMIEPEDFPKAL